MGDMTMKSARINVGMTQTEMAKALGVSLSAYQKYEDNPQSMRLSKFLKFCKITKRNYKDIKI
jgi:DNA-binding XRE family transcriptional regulator